ncbi:transient receptor potential cation channel subfamily M member-like 2 [Octopus vulgaris]|uniref:Transient receptor potential cation channel subfamily M member-like 2 n=1 Tax=Octopus vulgaris TaxID=6645 RepID=A0AA36BJD7_OCTVU|nr:transient receptor potential cation channel subfamily M member-like 2 [Octopus vulgaris]
MPDRNRQFGRRERKGKHTMTSSDDKSPTSQYESVPMLDITTNDTLWGQQSPESKEQPKKEDIKKWMQENIKLRPHQATSKKRVKRYGVKKRIVQPKILNAGKSREVNHEGEEETKCGNGFSPFDKRPPMVLKKRREGSEQGLNDIINVIRKHTTKVVEKAENSGSEDEWTSSPTSPTSPQPSSPLPQPQLPQPSPLSPSPKFSRGRLVMLASTAGKQQRRESEVETSSEESFGSDDEMYAFDRCISDEEEVSSPSESTDAFGEVKFVGYGRKIAKFVRADHETSMETMIYLIEKMWSLSLPKLLISVTGGRKDFLLSSHLKEAFGYGLVKAARSTGAWILSAGLHTGVVKYTGKAIYDNESTLTGSNKLVTISVAPWNSVRNKDTLKKKDGSWPAEYYITDDESCSRTCPLDPNHSHFFLVDDGTSDTFGVEIDFRKTLENAIVQNKIQATEVKIPAVAVMVGGGPGTLKSVYDSISRNIPVVIVKGSGRAADVLADAYQTVLENVNENSKDITDGKLENIKEIIQKKFEDYEHRKVLIKCVLNFLKQLNLVTLFESGSAEEFDVVVLKALFKVNNNKFEKLRLALEWNRIDIAKNELFTEEFLWPTGTLNNFMLFALRDDRVGFVKLFMEHGVSFKELLAEENIESLFRMQNKDISIENGHSLLNKLMNEGYFVERITDSFYIAIKLFLWALYLNRKEMAFLFWKEGMGALPSALIANNVLEFLKTKCKDYDRRIQLQEHADLYEERAIGILTECYYADEKRTLDLLLLRRKTWNDASCMQIAFNINNKKFVSQAACQSLLGKIWRGKICKKTNILKLLLCILCPLFIFFIHFHDKDKQDNNKETNKSCCCKPCGKCCRMFCRCASFYNAPIIKFLSNLIFYIIFLGIYSYVLLVELKPQIFYLEWFLIVWVIGIFTEEIHQIFKREMMLKKNSNSLCSKFVNYIHDIWNVVDVITIILFIIGYVLRFLKLDDAAKVMLSLNLITFYIRFLYMLSIHRHLGPKLIMIKKMMQDLGYFIVILFILMIAYGIASQSILYPSAPVSYDLFKKVFRKAYFHMYGELFLDEYEENCDASNSTCPSELGLYIAPILMCIYILLTNILLLNLLIAMFSNTFQRVQEKSRLHWSFQRYELIFEFSIRPPLPPPFILLCNIYQACRYLCEKASRKQPNRKSAFSKTYKTDLEKEKEKDLILWEDQMVDSYIARQNKSDSNKNLIDQLELPKYESSQNISFSEPEKEFTISANILNQRLQNIEEKINNIDTTLAKLKESLMDRKH